MPNHNKMTILPLHYCDWNLHVPIKLADDLTVENVEGLLQPENFELWRDYITKKDRDELASTKVGIVHRFFSEEHLGKPEADSQDRIYKAFVLLRLIRPTRLNYSHIQLTVRDHQPDVFNVAHPPLLTPNAPYLQMFNFLHDQHLHQLAELLPNFLKFAASAPWHLTRSTRFFEAGYSQITDPLLQFVIWNIGIASFFSEDKEPLTDSALRHRIEQSVGAETDIFSESEIALFPTKPTPLPVKNLLLDMFEMRNCVVHGVRVPPRFDELTTNNPATGEAVHYVDVLREGVSFILRKLVLRSVKEVHA
jgi:hypothetical protein